MLAGVSCFRWHITGLKLKWKYFPSCYFPLLLGFLYPLALEAEVLRNCREWCCVTMYGKTWQEEPMGAWPKHQPSSSARIRVVSFTYQAVSAKKTWERVVLGVSICFTDFSSLGNTQWLQNTLFFPEFYIILMIMYWLTSTHNTRFPCEINLSVF